MYIISDLHVGSPYFKRARFLSFLESIPDGATLILNGDTIDNPNQHLSADDQAVVDRISARSDRIAVVWLDGNHDSGYRPRHPSRITFATGHEAPDKRLFISHGAYFDNVMPQHRWFIRLFKLLHNLRLRIGASPMHVAEYAKRWAPLFRYLHNRVMRNAIRHAKENGYRAVACGHVHQPEHLIKDGIEYVNTGAWTELPTCYALLENNILRLMKWRGEGLNPEALEKLHKSSTNTMPNRRFRRVTGWGFAVRATAENIGHK